MELSRRECMMMAKRAFRREDAEVSGFGFESATDSARGFIAESNILWIDVKIDGKTTRIRSFVKSQPTNQYHFKLVQKTRAFFKEAQFFNTVYPLLKKYFTHQVFPKCYFSSPSVTTLEDLKFLGYVNQSSGILDEEHCRATLKTLASYHASSFLYEKEVGTTFDKSHQDILFVSWFSLLPDHPGNVHFRTGVRALTAVMDKYFSHESEDVRNKFIKVLEDVPGLLLPSKNHRNALSHNDLWSNNIMFRYRQDGSVENACLIDLQLFGYNPPAHDVFTLLLLNALDDSLRNNLKDLVHFYYTTFSEHISSFGQDPDELLSYEDFEKSKSESVPLALGSAVLFTHFTTLPEEYLVDIVRSEELMIKMMEKDRVDLVFKSIDNFPAYKNRLFATICNLLNYLKGDFAI
uniref:Putative kinase-like protein D1044.1 n=1 Tax=Lygus hesperus TaxID=30085 RepID=A0A0A9Z392_LYGHE